MRKTRFYKRIWIGAGVLLLVAAVFGIWFGMRKEKEYHIIYIPKVIDKSSDFWTQLVEGAEMAAAENGVRITVVAPESEEDYKKQNEWIEWAVAQKPSAVLLSPISYTETADTARKVTEADIPLVLIDSVMEEQMADAVIATNNIRLGETEGRFMKQFVTEQSKIAIIGHVRNSSTAIEREQGVRKGLGEYEDKIAEVVFCDSDYEKAYGLMMRLMEENPDIDLVAGLNEYSAVGAARAIRDKQMQEKIKVVGIDSSLEEIQMLEEGIFEGIVIQNPFKMGYMGVETTVKMLKGEKVLKYIDPGCLLITKESLHMEENQKLLFPF